MRKILVFWIFLLASLYYIPLSYAHSGDLIYVKRMVVRPTIDGIISPGEWDDAYKIRFLSSTHTYSWIGHTGLHTWYGYFKLDDDYLYIAIDAIDDKDPNDNDCAWFFFDINHNGVMDGGYSFPRNPGEDLVWTPDWRSPTENHARGFSSSPNSQTPHRIYEIRFPLAFNQLSGLGTSPGRTLGFVSKIQDVWFCEYIWPEGADQMNPTTWADLILSPPPVGGIILNINEAQLLTPLILLLQALPTIIIISLTPHISRLFGAVSTLRGRNRA